MKKLLSIVVAFLVIVFLIGCASSNPIEKTPNQEGYVAGFWSGLWHGLISIISLIGSILNEDIAVYQVHNNGFWYNLGFLIGVGGWCKSATTNYSKK